MPKLPRSSPPIFKSIEIYQVGNYFQEPSPSRSRCVAVLVEPGADVGKKKVLAFEPGAKKRAGIIVLKSKACKQVGQRSDRLRRSGRVDLEPGDGIAQVGDRPGKIMVGEVGSKKALDGADQEVAVAEGRFE